MESPATMSQAHTQRDTESLLAHADFLRALVSRLVADESTTDDILQATWLSALKHPPRAGGSVRAWLYRVAQNHVRQMRRGDGRRSAREQEVRRPAQVPSAADIVQRESARRSVVDAVVGLPEPYREVVLLRFYEDLPPRKVARSLGIPVETVRTRTRRGLALLRTRLDGEYKNDREGWTMALLPLLLRPTTPSVITSTTVAVGVAVLAATCLLILGWDRIVSHRTTPAEAARPATLVRAAPAEAPLEVHLPAEGAERFAASAAPAAPPAAAVAVAQPTTASLSGRVVDAKGSPLAGADVYAFAGSRPMLTVESGAIGAEALMRTRSGPGGAFEFAGLPLEFYLRAERDDLVSVGGLVGSLSSGETLRDAELVLTPGLELHGVVLDADGLPVPGCRIELRTQARRGYVRPTEHDGLVTGATAAFALTTDAAGEFHLAHLPAVKHFLHARHPDFAPAEQEVLPARLEPLVLTLPPGARSRVEVTDAEGLPVADCPVFWIGSDQVPAEARTDSGGRALLPAVPVDVAGRVLARHPDLAPTYSSPITAGGSVRLRLERAQAISGTVVDGVGRGVAGARVEARAMTWARDDGPPPALAVHQDRGAARTDAEGRFRLGGLGDGVHELHATVPGFLVPGASGTATPGQEPVRLVVGGSTSGTISLRGKVHDARSHAPITSYVLTARGPSNARIARIIESATGTFELALPRTEQGHAGSWSLAIRAEGYAPWDRATQDYGEASNALEIGLFAARDLDLTLRDSRGAPVENARVVITSLAGQPVTANMSGGIWMGSILVGPRGVARLAGLPAQELLLSVRVPDLPRLPPFQIDLSAGSGTVERALVLPYDLSSPRRTVEVQLAGDTTRVPFEVRVLDAEGVLCAGWTVRRDAEGLRVAKPLRHLVQRFDERGLLTHRGQAWLKADALTRDLGPQLLEGDDRHARFAARFPQGACRVSVELPGGERVSGELAADRETLRLELP